MASKPRITLCAVLTAFALAGCGGSDNATTAACESHPPLPVAKISYPNASAPVETDVNVVPMIDVTTGNGLDGAILRFDLIGGTLPRGLSLDPATGRLSGRVTGTPGSFSYTVRVSAECFTGSVSTSGVFFVSPM